MNSTIWLFIFMWIISIVLSLKFKNPAYLILPYVVFAINELLYISTGLSIFSSKDLTENFYDLSIIPTRNGAVHHNYSEGYYPNNDLTITPKQAENYKFDKIIELLGAQPGDVVLDMGCGTCSLGEYFATKGIKVIGLTLSQEQVKLCKDKNIKSYQRDFSKFYPDLVDSANHIVFMGSTEHIPTGPHHDQSSYSKKRDQMTKTLQHAIKYLKKDKPGRIFFSGLHINPKFKNDWELFFLQRAYGGTFMLNDPNYDIEKAADNAGLQQVAKRDSTREYYLATELNKDHFGNPSPFFSKSMSGLLVLGTIYPFAFYIYVYVVYGLWMWMFDGNHHFYGKENYSLKSMNDRPCTLWWYVGEKPKSERIEHFTEQSFPNAWEPSNNYSSAF